MHKESIAALEKFQKDAKEEYRKSHKGQFGLVEQLEDAERLVGFHDALQKSLFLLQKYTKEDMIAKGATILFDTGFSECNNNDYSFTWDGNKIRFNFYNVQDVWSQIEDQFHLIKSSVAMQYTKIAHPVTGGAVLAKFSECLEGVGWGVHQLENAKETTKDDNRHMLIMPSQLERIGYYQVKKIDGGIGTHDVLRCKLTVPILIIMHKDSLKEAYTSHYDESSPVDIQTWINSIAPSKCNFSKCTF
jgi:hypothetical protein